MRTPANHRLFLVSLSVFLGWSLPLAGRAAAGHGPAETVALAGQNQPTTPVQPPAGTRAVQVPPLQAPADAPAPGNPVVVVSTSLGDITLELFKDRAPVWSQTSSATSRTVSTPTPSSTG